MDQSNVAGAGRHVQPRRQGRAKWRADTKKAGRDWLPPCLAACGCGQNFEPSALVPQSATSSPSSAASAAFVYIARSASLALLA